MSGSPVIPPRCPSIALRSMPPEILTSDGVRMEAKSPLAILGHMRLPIAAVVLLLSGYQLTGDARLLHLADDLGTRLLPAFNTPTGMPYMYVNLRTGKTSGTRSNPAEIGTLILEFGTLSKLTNKPVYFEKAKRAIVQLYKRRSKIGLVGEEIDVDTGLWVSRKSHIGGGIDSYYEYLFKCARDRKSVV